jgi:leader peptidase (prepilin peptidase) / N-methyltransferase
MLSHLVALYVSHAHIIAFILGALVGSFLNVVIHRLPLQMSIVRPRSHCPHCGDQIPGYLNVPILSWIVLRGKCRKCKAKISPRYPLVELLTALLFVASVQRFGVSIGTLAAMLMSAGLIVITFVDIDHWEIPDEISFPGIIIGVLIRPFAFDAPWYDGVLGAFAGAFALAFIRWAYYVFRKIEGMGLGDVKLIAMIGAFLGLRALIPVVLVASLAGSLIGGVVLLFGRRGKTEEPDAHEEPEEEEPAPKRNPMPRTPIAFLIWLYRGFLLLDIEDDEEVGEDGEEKEWTPHRHAVPFGPFLAIGGLTHLFLGDLISRMLMRLI